MPFNLSFAVFIDEHVAAALRRAAFVVILIEGGLGLDVQAFKRLKGITDNTLHSTYKLLLMLYVFRRLHTLGNDSMRHRSCHRCINVNVVA